MHPTARKGLTTGSALAALTTGTMMIAATIERRSPWAGLNAMATAIDVGESPPEDGFDAEATPVGIALLVGGLVVWGMLYEGALAASRRQSNLATGALSGSLAFALDRFVLSKRLVPNFRRTLGTYGVVAKYLTVGLVSAFSARLHRRSEVTERGAGARRTSTLEAASSAAEAEEIGAVQRPPADS